MINFDDYTNENLIEHNSKWPYIPDHPYRILIIGGSGSGKRNALFNLINNQPDIDKIYLYAKDPYDKKYQYLINKHEKVGLNHFNDPKAFMEYSNDMQDVHKNIEDYNPIKKRKILIVFDDIIADMINNNKLNPIVTELFIRGRKLNISIVFITQSYFKVPKDVRLNSTHFFIMKIPNKRELQQIALNHSSDIDFKDFMNIYKKYTKEPYSFLVNDTTLPSDDPLRFRKNLLGQYIIKIMTIEDQIKDEKLQDDINREAARISALSSGKIDKYEYLTGEDILRSNQQQIIQKAKFNYSPLGKALEKRIKAIEYQGKKQVKAIQNNKQIVNKYDYKDRLLLSKEREIFRDIYNKRLDKIEELNKEIDYDDLDYVVFKSNMEYNFSMEKDPITFLNDIKKGEASVEEAKDRQKNYLRYLNILRKGNKNAEQRKALANINMLYNARNNAIKFIEDYVSMIFEAKKLVREHEGTGLKILTPNQMLKRLPIAPAQVKAGNNSESLLNEIRQIVYSLYRSKEITKKVYNNIINSIKV